MHDWGWVQNTIIISNEMKFRLLNCTMGLKFLSSRIWMLAKITLVGELYIIDCSKNIARNHRCVRLKMQLQLVFASIVKWLGCPPCIYGAHCKLAEPELRGFFFDIVHSTHSLIIGIYANQKVRTNPLYSLGMPFCNVRKFTRITQRKKEWYSNMN